MLIVVYTNVINQSAKLSNDTKLWWHLTFNNVTCLYMYYHSSVSTILAKFFEVIFWHNLIVSKSSTCWGDHGPGWPLVTQGRATTKVTDNVSFQYANHVKDCPHVYYTLFLVELTNSTYLVL